MNALANSFRHATPSSPCPVCRRDSWCSFTDDGRVVVCMRVAAGSVRETRNGGYLHRLGDDRRRRHGSFQDGGVRTFLISDGRHRDDLGELAGKYQNAATPGMIEAAAVSLGVTAAALTRLGVGWAFDFAYRRGVRAESLDAGDVMRAGSSRALSFGMRNPDGKIVGIRIRTDAGEKFAVAGSHNGLFLADGLDLAGTMLIAEGPTDTAALLGFGFDAVGRSSCAGDVGYVVKLVRTKVPQQVVVVGDGDGPGRRGAESLASTLLPYARCVKVLFPPEGVKDARAWLKAGGTAEDVRAAIDAARIRSLTFRRAANA
jgi:hypothetical protein